jgi:PhnB protein
MKVNPYIQFGGRCAQAFEFYRQHLGARDIMLMPFRGSPAEQHAPADWLDKIMHGSMTLDGEVLMGSDGMAGVPFEGMKGCSLSLSVATPEEAERVFRALGDGGAVTIALESNFFASRFGMLTDKFGVSWMVICELPRS